MLPDTRRPDTRTPDTRKPDSQKPPICGNNKAEPGEQCDGTDLRGEMCLTMGNHLAHYHGPFLLCDLSCHFYVKNCWECGNANKPNADPATMVLEGYEECEFSHDAVTNKAVTLWKDGKNTCAAWGLKGTKLYCKYSACLVYCL